jgi:hypothetical protein
MRPPTAQQVVASHRDDDAAELFGISQLCAEFGITLRTIRFYEDSGTLLATAAAAYVVA